MKKQTNTVWAASVLALCGVSLMAAQLGHAKEETMSLTLKSTAFTYEGEIPAKYTCQGEDIAPSLEWEGVPAGTKSLVLIVDDPDAPDPRAPKMTWVHWVVYNIPPETTGFPEGATPGDLPPQAKDGLNDWKRPGYGGPCPPIGRHRYFHKLYALDTVLAEMNNPMKADVIAAMKGHVIAEAILMGTYKKK